MQLSTSPSDARVRLVAVTARCSELLVEAKRIRGKGLGMIKGIAPRTADWLREATVTVDEVFAPGAKRVALLHALKDPDTLEALTGLGEVAAKFDRAIKDRKLTFEQRSIESEAINERMIASLSALFAFLRDAAEAVERLSGASSNRQTVYGTSMDRLVVDILAANKRAYVASFTRGDDNTRNGDYHYLWEVVLSCGGQQHHSTAAISGMVRAVLTQRGPIEEATVLANLVRVYRRNIDEILGTLNALVVIKREQLVLFEDEPQDALARVQAETEEILFTLAQVPAVLSSAAENGAEMSLPLPEPEEWPAFEPLIRVQSSHAAFREFFAEYEALRQRHFYANEVKSVASAARRCSTLGALALSGSQLEPLQQLGVTAR